MHDNFIEHFFESESEFEKFRSEFLSSNIPKQYEYAQQVAKEEKGSDYLADIGLKDGVKLYSIIRKHQPNLMIETGVAHGVSSMIILSAMKKNEAGELISVDYTFQRDKNNADLETLASGEREDILDQWRKHGEIQKYESLSDLAVAVPENKKTGWVVSEDLRDRWTLELGRSQRRLPEIMSDIDSLDIFMHDSDHRLPCQVLEYEIGWEWLTDGGILLSHNAGNPWEEFSSIRRYSRKGNIDETFGYLIK